MSLPPAFPEWMRRADPILAREDTNTLFQAFRELRLRRQGWMARWNVAPLGVALALAVLFALVPFGYAFWIAVAGAAAYRRFRGYFASRQTRLPDRVTALFRSQSLARSVAVDIWLCPEVGSEVLEAVYLERRELNLLAFKTVSILVGVVTLGAFTLFHIHSTTGLEFRLPVLLLLLTLC